MHNLEGLHSINLALCKLGEKQVQVPTKKIVARLGKNLKHVFLIKFFDFLKLRIVFSDAILTQLQLHIRSISTEFFICMASNNFSLILYTYTGPINHFSVVSCA